MQPFRRYRAPLTLVTFAAFWASLMAPLTAAAQANADRAAALQAAERADVAQPAGSETPQPTDSASQPRLADPKSAAAKDALQDAEEQALDPDAIKAAAEAAKIKADQEPLQTTALPSGDDKSGVTSKSISVPKGSGTVQGMGESFSAQLSTGIATYSVPFALPSARGGVQPSLGLSYSSSGGHGTAGVGWNVGSAFISRQTDRGLPTYDDRSAWHPNQDRFVFNGGQELVPICDVSPSLACAGALPDEQMPAWSAGWQYHRPRVEGGFMRFFWSPARTTWRVQSKSGQVLELGVPLDSSNYAGALERNPAHPQEIYRWYVSREYDTYTDTGASDGQPLNVVHYRYTEDGGSKYLADIYDTTPVDSPTTRDFARYAHHTRLIWEPRSDTSHSYRSGWRMEQNLRLAKVDVTSAPYGNEGRELLRRYLLSYDSAYHVSLLEQVQVQGRCPTAVTENASGQLPDSLGCQPAALPPMRFGYSHVGTPTNDGFEPFSNDVRELSHSPPHSLDEALTDLFDINADGLPDVLVTAPGYYGGGYGWFENGGTGELEDFASVQNIALRGVLGANANTLQLTNLNLVPLDLDGDGRTNLLHMPKVKTYSVYDFVKVGSKYELQGRVIDTANGQSPKIDFGKDTTDIQVMDVNFDGLVDVVNTTGTQVETFFSLGRLPGGDGQFGVGKYQTARTAQLSTTPAATCVPHSALPVRFSDPETKVADINGDGIPDIVRLQSGAVRYWPGRGNGFWGTGPRDDCPAGTFGSGRHVTMTNAPTFFGEGLRLDDVNGDGFPDLVNIRFDEIDVWLNVNGEGWTARKIIDNTPATPGYLNRVRLVDVDGSGTRDVVWGNAGHYKYIDLQGGSRPWILTEVQNGLGKTTSLEYTSSADEMLAARRGGKPWSSTAPMVLHLVKRMTETDNLNVFGKGARSYTTEYSYRDPIYDGRQREFRGFREATSTTFGDANSPTSHARSEFLLGECAYADGSPCAVSDQSFDNPNEALKGLPVVSESYDANGVYLSTSHTHYSLRKLYEGLDARGVVYAFASSNTNWAYDTANPGAFASPSQQTLPTVTPEDASSGAGAGVGAPALDLPVTVRATAGTVRSEGFSEVDDFGNALRGVSKGCVSGCPSGSTDDEIEQVTTPTLLPHDSGWLWRTSSGYTTSRDFPARRGESSTSYTPEGNPDTATAVLSGTEALQRSHATGGSIAPIPGDAVADSSTLFVSSTEYDQFGNAIRSSAPGGRCADVFLDPLYAQLSTTEMMYPSGCPGARSLSSPPADTLYTAASYDRGLEAVTHVIDVSFQITQVEYDGLGRLTQLFRSDPGSATVGSLPAVQIFYDLATPSRPYSVVHTRSQDGAAVSADAYMDSYAYVDGMGRSLVGISEADPSANDEGQWIVGGFVEYDAKGAVSKKYLPKFWTGNPTSFNLTAPPGTAFGRVEYDAFGRDLRLYDLDGTQTLLNVYHPLSSDAWDAADLQTGGPHAGTYVTSVSDGHGRGVLGIERFKEGGSLIQRETRTQFLPTGEPLSITRSSVHGSTTRWLRYDSLGRMVLNVEPHTSENFDPNPFADASNIKAWRYLYNASGELVATSDARGCGINFSYDGVGRLLYEDYSPCEAQHQAYSPPAQGSGAPTGVEVYYHYDSAPPAAFGTPEIPIGSGQTEGYAANSDFLRGKLVAVFDRAKTSWTNYDGRSRAFESWVRLAAPGVPDNALGNRYGGRWYRKQVSFDAADRVVQESTGARSPELMGGDGQSWVQMAYSERGTVKNVGGSYGALVTDIKRTADGLHQHIEYGDLAATTTAFAYDQRRRLSSVQAYRGPPSAWANPPGSYSVPTDPTQTTFQKVLQNDQYIYDIVGNPTRIEDLRNPDEWPSGAKPVTRSMQYDDLYRVTRVDYGYSKGDDTISKPEVTPAPMGVGPAGFLTRATPRIGAQRLTQLQHDAAQKPDLRQVQPQRPSAPAVETPPVGLPQAGGSAPSKRAQALELDPSLGAQTPDLTRPDLSAVDTPNASGLSFRKLITTSPTSFTGPTRPTYYWNRVRNATSYRIETIDSNGFQHEFVASPSQAHCSVSGQNCYYYPPTSSNAVSDPRLPRGAARFRVVPTTSGFPFTRASDWRYFGVRNAKAAVAGNLLLPATLTGTLSDAIFTRGAHVSRFRLYIRDNATYSVIHDSNAYPAYSACVDSRCGVVMPSLAAGNYTVWIQFQNEHAGDTAGPWSSPIDFATHPEVPSPLAPVADVESQPWIAFRAVSGASEYQVEYSGPSGDPATRNLLASICSGGVCGTFMPTLGEGAWRWRVKALVSGTYRQPSSWVRFSYGSIPPVTAPSPSLPIGNVTSPTQFTWNQGGGTSRFSVEIKTSSGSLAVPTVTYPKSTFGCLTPGSYCTYYGPTLPSGNYTWRVAALNEHDTRVWTAPRAFSVTGTVITLLGPSGAGVAQSPTYRWQGPSDVDVYELEIRDGSGARFYNDYTLGDLGCDDGSPCEINPPFNLSNNAAGRWRVHAYGGVLNGSVSTWMDFSRGNVPALGDASALGPSGQVGSPLRLTWTAGPGSSEHYLWLADASNVVLSAVLRRADTGCVGSSACSYTPSLALSGDYTFYVLARSETASANWVGPASFNLDPDGPTPISPSTFNEGPAPTFVFTARQGATQYYVEGNDAHEDGFFHAASPAALGCASGGRCSMTIPGLNLPAGASQWRVRALVAGVYTPWKVQNFAVGALEPVQAPLAIAPTGLVASPVELSWQADPGSSHYEYEVINAAGQIEVADDSAALDFGCTPGTTQTCRRSTLVLAPGSYTWRVRGSNVHAAVSPWSATLAFQVDADAPTPISPSADISQSRPTYRFTQLAGAQSYYFHLWDSSGELRELPVPLSAVSCSGGICSYNPPYSTDLPAPSVAYDLAPGACSWAIRGQTSTGSWTLHDWQQFSYNGVPALGVPTQISPQGVTSQPTVSLTWSRDAAASRYDTWILRSGSVVEFRSQSKAQAGCSAGQPTCSGPTLNMLPGDYTWYVASVNAHGRGAISPGMNYSVMEPLVAPVITAPIGNLRDTLPVYSWTSQPNVTEYELRVDNTSGQLISKRYTPSELGCPGGANDCSITPAVVLGPGSHTVWARGVNAAGNGPWSAPEVFNVVAPLVDQDDGWDDPNSGLPDARRAEPTPYQEFENRIRYQAWDYDWLGNTATTDDDAKGFYDRSLGNIQNGPLAGKAYQLQAADNRSSGSARQGALRTTYDVTGNLTEMRLDRDGTCLPSGRCSQIFRYEWDEVGRLVTAKRWDASSLLVSDTTPPSGVPDVELHYGYDASDMRVSKRAVDTLGEESWTLYLFNSLELRRTNWTAAEQDYALTPMTEVAYLFANGVRLARLAYEPPGDVPSINGENLHVFFELGDHLGSTSVVLDKATGELVERSTYQAYGGTESDYRPERWKSFREDYRFTGKEEDVEVGLIYFGKRFLNPLLNRWVSADPLAIHGLGADPNLYAYVSGRVLQSVDPLGLDGCGDGNGGCGSGPGQQEGTPENGSSGTGNATSQSGGASSSPSSEFTPSFMPKSSATAEPDTAPARTAAQSGSSRGSSASVPTFKLQEPKLLQARTAAPSADQISAAPDAESRIRLSLAPYLDDPQPLVLNEPKLRDSVLKVGGTAVSAAVGREGYVQLTARVFGSSPSTYEGASRLVWGRGYERIGYRGFGLALSGAVSYRNAKPYLDQGDYGGAAAQSWPFGVALTLNTVMHVRDYRKYGSVWGLVGNAPRREQMILTIMNTTRTAGETSAGWSGGLRVLGRGAGYAVFMYDLSNTWTDAHRPDCIGCPARLPPN